MTDEPDYFPDDHDRREYEAQMEAEAGGRPQQAAEAVALAITTAKIDAKPNRNRDDAISCVVFGIIGLIVAFAVIWSVTHVNDALDWWRSFQNRTAVLVEVPVLEATLEATSEVICEPAPVCPSWIDSERDLAIAYRDQVRPLADTLRDIAGDYRNISDAMRRTSAEDVLHNEAWRALAEGLEGRLDAAFESLNGIVIPGSVAGTHVRLTRAVGFLYTCEVEVREDIAFILRAKATYQLGSYPLSCAFTTDGNGATSLTKAQNEILQAYTELEDLK